ncbi:MAG: hypothetical protein IVW57_13015, partial [Ktedonobacterales bacterium]|nr:hypothetical protein [Ktedonobacterales bacterium]
MRRERADTPRGARPLRRQPYAHLPLLDDEASLPEGAPPPEPPRQTAVIPALTLPSHSAIPAPSRDAGSPRAGSPRAGSPRAGSPRAGSPRAPRPRADASAPQPSPDSPDVRSNKHRALASIATADPPAGPSARSHAASHSRVLIPGGNVKRLVARQWRATTGEPSRLERTIRQHRKLFSVLVLLAVLGGILADATGIGRDLGLPTPAPWLVLSGVGLGPTPTPVPPPPAPNFLDAAHYVNTYGFDYPQPQHIRPLPADERQRLIFMLPYAVKAAAAYDQRYRASIEPQLIVWWTHAEGIGGRINYSNCANYTTRAGTNYFSNIENCPRANFWQLGYGNQFSVIYVLKNAFADTHGDPNNPQLVQQVGQWVLNYDRQQGTVPP